MFSTAVLASPNADSSFSISIGGAGQQFVTAGGVVSGVRGVVNEQLGLSRVSLDIVLLIAQFPCFANLQNKVYHRCYALFTRRRPK